MGATPASPVVSVVVPSFNYGHLIAQTLDSVLAQSSPDWECVVVDDGSTDDTADVVSAYTRRDRRFSYVSQRNAGLSAARNAGLRRSQGTYFQFLDADDVVEPSKLEHHVSYLNAHPYVGIVYGPARYFTTADPTQRRYSWTDPDTPWMPQVSGSGQVLVNALLDTNIMPVNSALVRREVLRRIGPFDERLQALEDWEYWIRCALGGVHFHFLDRENTYALVRLHEGSMSTDSLRMRAALVRHYRTTVRLAPNPTTRTSLCQRLVEARKALSELQIARGMILKGGLHRASLAFSQRHYTLAAKIIVALLLVPVLGRSRFASWTERS